MKNSKLKHLKDEELVALYVDTQRNTYFEELYDRYANKVYRKCYSFVYDQEKAQDFTHDIFLKLIVKIGTFKETSKFSTWLYSITYNYCMDQIRVKKKQKEYALDENYDIEDSDDSGLVELQSQGLHKSLEKMPSDEKALLLMKYQDDFSIKEISETLKISESAVKMRLLRSKDKLRKLYLENMAVFALIILKIIYLLRK
ncbi:MAG: RNA polymerase sigma factor [Cytophagaceae bacterium]|nr:RNA polymerase sigma factor [Cytophagaceae bacterium]MBK9508808.1 RNA polymerase sigma factor [Cytophagaceae bacterium]MBK9935713.1 RNA polymerase sigma factor [Cytophagaceae bacterium]MBL0302154.1 RNA polymerase sigma factor [Cytophagaceae bacterium]MBL0324974.1 RNA polymerase sigma factor [Cytophagaceae bacterium]